MRRFLIAILFVSCAVSAYAQKSGKVSGTLIDKITSETIPGAVIEYAPVKDSTNKKHTTSGVGGKFSLGTIAYGDYNVKITSMGYADLKRKVTVASALVNLGTLVMDQKSTQIEGVTKQVQAMRTTQKGDTLVYNASAFKVSVDADAEGLLSKMPGVTITDSGVEAQGETVKKIFVDGKEFFGSDVSSAIKNLPAEVVDKIEVYNKLSDQAEFTGVDDGEGFKAINIVTKVDMRRGQFGKMYAGYGIDDKYVGGGNVNVFKGDSRLSFIGLINNINQQNFSTEDILGVTSSGGRGSSSRGGGSMRSYGGGGGNFMVGQQSGVSKVASIGVNYSDKWGEKLEFSGSYFFNTNKNDNNSLTQREYYSETPIYQYYKANSLSNSRNYNHRINAKLDYKINDNNSLMIRPSVSFQKYNTGTNTDGNSSYLGGELEDLIYNLTRNNNSKSTGYNLSNSILYRAKLGKPGRTLTLDASGQMGNNDRTSDDFSQTDTYIPAPPSVTAQQQYILNNSRSHRLEGSVMYTEPLTTTSQLSMMYRVSYNYSDADKKSYDERIFTEEYLNPDLSNVYNSGYTRHRVGPGYRLGNKKITLATNLYYQYSTLTGDREFPTNVSNAGRKYDFNNILYFVMMNYTFTPTNTLRVFLRSSTENPSVTQLQDVVDTSNPQFVTLGNPELRPTYGHSLFAHYVKSSVTKGRTFMFMFGASLKDNYIADSTAVAGSETIVGGVTLEPNARYTRPVNMNGYWNVRTMVSFGTPIKPIKSNLNVNIGATFSESPSIISGARNLSQGQYYNAGVVLGSNINENVDFTLSYNGGYNIVKNSINSNGNNTYLTQSASGNIKVVIWRGFTFTGSAAYANYRGISSDFNEEYVICNAYIGKKFLKNNRAEINVGVNDILDQNRGFSRNVTDTYIENVTSNAIGRYVSVKLIYNLRNFGKKGSAYQSGDADSSLRPVGVPPGAMPPGVGGARPPVGGHGGGGFH